MAAHRVDEVNTCVNVTINSRTMKQAVENRVIMLAFGHMARAFLIV